jgi:hypothetical protein
MATNDKQKEPAQSPEEEAPPKPARPLKKPGRSQRPDNEVRRSGKKKRGSPPPGGKVPKKQVPRPMPGPVKRPPSVKK